MHLSRFVSALGTALRTPSRLSGSVFHLFLAERGLGGMV